MGTDENFHKELQAAVKSCGTDDNGMVPIKSLKVPLRTYFFVNLFFGLVDFGYFFIALIF